MIHDSHFTLSDCKLFTHTQLHNVVNGPFYQHSEMLAIFSLRIFKCGCSDFQQMLLADKNWLSSALGVFGIWKWVLLAVAEKVTSCMFAVLVSCWLCVSFVDLCYVFMSVSVSVHFYVQCRKLSDGLFLECCRAVAEEYPSVKFESMIIDNTCMQAGCTSVWLCHSAHCVFSVFSLAVIAVMLINCTVDHVPSPNAILLFLKLLSQKMNQYEWFLVHRILRKFYTRLHIFPPRR